WRFDEVFRQQALSLYYAPRGQNRRFDRPAVFGMFKGFNGLTQNLHCLGLQEETSAMSLQRTGMHIFQAAQQGGSQRERPRKHVLKVAAQELAQYGWQLEFAAGVKRV